MTKKPFLRPLSRQLRSVGFSSVVVNLAPKKMPGQKAMLMLMLILILSLVYVYVRPEGKNVHFRRIFTLRRDDHLRFGQHFLLLNT